MMFHSKMQEMKVSHLTSMFFNRYSLRKIIYQLMKRISLGIFKKMKSIELHSDFKPLNLNACKFVPAVANVQNVHSIIMS